MDRLKNGKRVGARMDNAKVLIIDKNVELYEYSTGIWAEYGIKTHRVNNIEQALEEVSVYKYHLLNGL